MSNPFIVFVHYKWSAVYKQTHYIFAQLLLKGNSAWWSELTEYNVNYSVQRCNWWIKNIHYTNIAFQSISKLCTNFSFKLNHLHLLKQIIKRSISKLTIILVVIFDVSFHTISNVLSNVSKINFICTLNEKNITLSEQFQYQILKSKIQDNGFNLLSFK